MAKFNYRKWINDYKNSNKGLFEQVGTGSIGGDFIVGGGSSGTASTSSGAWIGSGSGAPNNPLQSDFNFNTDCNPFSQAPQDLQDLVCGQCQDPTYINMHCECCGESSEDNGSPQGMPTSTRPDREETGGSSSSTKPSAEKPRDTSKKDKGKDKGKDKTKNKGKNKGKDKGKDKSKSNKTMNSLKEIKRIIEQALSSLNVNTPGAPQPQNYPGGGTDPKYLHDKKAFMKKYKAKKKGMGGTVHDPQPPNGGSAQMRPKRKPMRRGKKAHIARKMDTVGRRRQAPPRNL